MSPEPPPRHRPSRSTPGDRRRGRVLWFNQVQGVGLLRVPGLGQLHVYYKDIEGDAYRALDAGDEVSFWLESTRSGPVARQVRVEHSLPRE